MIDFFLQLYNSDVTTKKQTTKFVIIFFFFLSCHFFKNYFFVINLFLQGYEQISSVKSDLISFYNNLTNSLNCMQK